MTRWREKGSDAYALVIVGIAGAVYGVGSYVTAPTDFRVETLESARRKAPGAALLDLSDPARADAFFGAIRGAPRLNLALTERGPEGVPLSEYLAYWAAAGARIGTVS